MSNFVVNKHGHNVSHSQHSNLPHMKHESIIVPSTSAPSWGGYFVIDFRERNVVLHDIVLQFNVSALTGYTGTPTIYLVAYCLGSAASVQTINSLSHFSYTRIA